MFRPRHVPLFPALATCAAALILAITAPLPAASSYFMVQGPLAPGGVYETYKFRVEYTGVLSITGFTPAEQNSGLTLMAAIFGNGTSTQPFSNSVGTVSIPSGFVDGFQMQGGSLVLSGPYPSGPQWGYFVAGGSYVNAFPGFPTTTGDYDDSAWTASNTGIAGRFLEDGSIDAWSYALMTDTGIDDDWGDVMIFTPPTGVTPTLGDFTGSQYSETKVSGTGLPYSVYRITSVPEPGRAFLLLLGASVVLVRRSRIARV